MPFTACRSPLSAATAVRLHVIRDLRVAVRGLARGRIVDEWRGVGLAGCVGLMTASSSNLVTVGGIMLVFVQVFAALTATPRSIRRRFQREFEHEFFSPQSASTLAFIDVVRVMTWVALSVVVYSIVVGFGGARNGVAWSVRDLAELLPLCLLGGLGALNLTLMMAAKAHCEWMSELVALLYLVVIALAGLLAIAAQYLTLVATTLPGIWGYIHQLGLWLVLLLNALLAVGVALAIHRTATPECTLLEPMRVSSITAAVLSQPE